MWRRPVVGSLGFLPAMSVALGGPPTTLACAAGGALAQQHRTVFVRDHRSPVTIKTSGLAYPAVLSWKFRSDRPKHLVVNITRPTKAALASTDEILDEDPEGAKGEAGEAEEEVASASYNFGRLFLRPYNVGQLLAVLQGWTEEPAAITRQHASLTLAPASITGNKRKPLPLSSFVLQGTFTTKTSPVTRPKDTAATATFENDDGVPGSTYNLDDVRAIEMELKEGELMLLICHLEAVLRDFFSIEHRYHYRLTRSALDRQRDRLAGSTSAGGSGRRYASREGVPPRRAGSPREVGETHYRSRAARSPTSGRHHGDDNADPHRQQRQQQPPPLRGRPVATTAEEDEVDLSAPFEEVGTDARAHTAARAAASAAVSAFVSTARTSPASATPAATQAVGEGDEDAYEEGEEGEENDGVEEFSVDEVAQGTTTTESKAVESVYEDMDMTTTTTATAAKTAAPPAAERGDADKSAPAEEDEEEYEEVEVVEEVEEDDNDGEQQGGSAEAEEPAAAPATAERDTPRIQNVQRGEIEVERANHYAKARFVSGDNFVAADINEVGKAFGLDVVQNTKVAVVTNKGGLAGEEVRDTKALTSGTFRSEGGTLTGSYQVLRERVEATTTTTIAGGPAEAAVPEGVVEVAVKGEKEGGAEEDEEAEVVVPAAAQKAKGKRAKKKKATSRKKSMKKGKARGRKSPSSEDTIEESVAF